MSIPENRGPKFASKAAAAGSPSVSATSAGSPFDKIGTEWDLPSFCHVK
jgi:hypothetical protein